MARITLAQRKHLGALAKDGPRTVPYPDLRITLQLVRAGLVTRDPETEVCTVTDAGRAALVAAHRGDLVAVHEEHRYTGTGGFKSGGYTTITLGRVVTASHAGAVVTWERIPNFYKRVAAHATGVRFHVCDGRLIDWDRLLQEPELSFDTLQESRDFLVRFMK